MMQTCCVYLIYGGLGFSHPTLRIFAFQTAACFICHLKIGGKLKVFLLGAIYTRKPQNGGQSWKRCYKRVSSLRLRHYPQAPFHFYPTNTSLRRSNKEGIYKIGWTYSVPVQNVPVLQNRIFLRLTIVMYLCYQTVVLYSSYMSDHVNKHIF